MQKEMDIVTAVMRKHGVDEWHISVEYGPEPRQVWVKTMTDGLRGDLEAVIGPFVLRDSLPPTAFENKEERANVSGLSAPAPKSLEDEILYSIMRLSGPEIREKVYTLVDCILAHEKNANEDYRGNRSSASIRSFNALKKLKKELGIQ